MFTVPMDIKAGLKKRKLSIKTRNNAEVSG
ncbi:hypothetical protein LSS_20730 [Leptospira santarosai serovar Shermani str. LT 821]|uniref:Uncharacterized protein n=1 Tax=Leptospira santarosai serovar Shermani str. LT 821 TaxID=758847 RepID=A0A097ES92_9LEPT|nr:hypothetical protein LSS_20730 [Leptospira santarosai serovar Shermani str. LT 821]